MVEKRTLRAIVTENWDSIIQTLKLNMENKPENMFLLFRYFEPVLKSAATAFPRPSTGIYLSVNDAYKKDIILLQKMGFVDGESYSNSYGLTNKGVDLMNCYHKSINQDFRTENELIADIIKLSDHLY